MRPEKNPFKRFKQNSISDFFARTSNMPRENLNSSERLSQDTAQAGLNSNDSAGKGERGLDETADTINIDPSERDTLLSFSSVVNLEESPLDESPLVESPLDEIPLDESPLDESPMEDLRRKIDGTDEELNYGDFDVTAAESSSANEDLPGIGCSKYLQKTINPFAKKTSVNAANFYSETRQEKQFHYARGLLPEKFSSEVFFRRRESSESEGSSPEKNPIPLNLDQEAGAMPDDLIRFPENVTWQPGTLESSAEHTVLIQTPFVAGEEPSRPDPISCNDIWDQHHVRMPNSAHSLYVNEDGMRIQRWELIERALLAPIRSVSELKDAILSYNGGFSWDMKELEDTLEIIGEREKASFFDDLLPKIIKLALRMPDICTIPPPLLARGHSHSITMSQMQASCLLANAFLSTFPRRNTTQPYSQFSNYPTINFQTLFRECLRTKRSRCRKEKIRCILNYFWRVTEKSPEGNITFARVKLRCALGWETSQAKFQKAFVTSEGLIEDDGHGMLMVDFANQKVGGGVLRDGCVQEEILYLIYPELICSRLFTEALADDEALLVTGVERFNKYKNWSDDFKWEGNVTDLTERDSWGRKYTQFVAIDALAHRGKRQQREQFTVGKVLRELVKAFCGFQTPGFPRSCLATGNWGCGAFGGDTRLKFLIQWMAASRAGRQLVYFTFGNHELMCELRALQDLIIEQNINIGNLFILLKLYDRLHVSTGAKSIPSLSEFLFKNFHPDDSS